MKSNTSFLSPSNFIVTLVFSILLSVFSISSYAANPAESANLTTQTVNVNTADAKTIAKALKGIGIKKAEAIVDYRERYGNFAHLDELVAVKGIGKSTLSKNAHLLSLQ